MIPFNEFGKIELKAAKIISVEYIPGKDRLYKIIIDLGNEKRQIVSGLKGHYQKEELLGKTIVVVSNLEHAKIAGIESQAMLLAAKNIGGKYRVIETDESVPAGAIVE